MESLRYIPLISGEKRPKRSLTNENMITYDQIENETDVAVFVEYPYVIIDIDDEETGKIVFDIIEDEEINSRVYKTNRGYHFWFKWEHEQLKSVSKVMNPLSLEYDIKAWGVKKSGEEKRAYVIIKTDGEMREVIRDCDINDLDELPVFLQMAASHKIAKYDMHNMRDGDGRNGILFEYILLLQKEGFKPIDIKYIFSLINDYVFKTPLGDDELNTILRDEAFVEMDSFKIDDVYDLSKGTLQHHLFAPIISEKLGIKTINGDTYLYKDGYHQKAFNAIERKMIEYIPPLKKTQRVETLEYIKLITHMENPPLDQYSVNVRNGRLNMQTGKISEHNPRYFDTSRVDVMYDPNAYCEITHNMLMKVACGDVEIFELIKQIIGYTLVKHNRFQVMFFLHGRKASNGKSTFLNMITSFLGEDNVTSLSIKDLNDKYKPAELEHKLANIGDDVSGSNIKESEIFKKVVSGEAIQVERKYQDSFGLRNYATLLFAGNYLPSFSDKSEGVNRRLIILPFNAKFSRTDDDFNPNIEEDITTDLAKSYLLNLAIEGYQQVEKNKGFIKPKASQEALDEFKVNSSTVMLWANDEGYGVDDFVGQLRDTMYSEYKRYAENSGINYPISQYKFVQEINEHFGLITVQARVGDNRARVFQVEEE